MVLNLLGKSYVCLNYFIITGGHSMLQQAVCFGVMDARSVSLGAAGELWVTAF